MSKYEDEFYTVRGYELLEKDRTILTPSMEDYLEMTYRLTQDKGYTRISDLATALNVQPPSATNMIKKLALTPYLNAEKYGIIQLTEQGQELGAYLLKRHEIIEQFLIIIGVKENVLEETEKIEHNVSSPTLECIAKLVEFLKENYEWQQNSRKY
ncbi:MAG: transcriptional regulator MntR [Syntrophomonadaceae bacterium]|nr:transcriptional regulator MntR [Syntrophomonadaceae bacterium]